MKTASSLTAGCLALTLLTAGCASVPGVESRLQGLQFHPNLYVVQVNDTIDSIAYRYQLSPLDLVALNPGLESGPIPGQRINVVPGTQMSDAVRQGRQWSRPATARTDSYPADGNTMPDGQWPQASAPAQGEESAVAYSNQPARAVQAGPQEPVADPYGYPSEPARTASVDVPPPVVARPLPVPTQPTWQTESAPAPQGNPAARQQAQAPRGGYGQDMQGNAMRENSVASEVPRQVGGEIRASARSTPVPGDNADDQLLSGARTSASQPPAWASSDGRDEAERLAMASPQAGGWPREEIIADDLDFEPVSERAEPAASTEGFSGRWAWPTNGQIVRGFQPDRVGGQGVDIAGVPGQDVRAAMDGTVVYSGRDLSGQGNLIILRHPDDLLSTYSHTRNLYVAEDDVVRSGDSIASLGSNENQESVLGFEIRRDGNPLNPLDFLPVP